MADGRTAAVVGGPRLCPAPRRQRAASTARRARSASSATATTGRDGGHPTRSVPSPALTCAGAARPGARRKANPIEPPTCEFLAGEGLFWALLGLWASFGLSARASVGPDEYVSRSLTSENEPHGHRRRDPRAPSGSPGHPGRFESLPLDRSGRGLPRSAGGRGRCGRRGGVRRDVRLLRHRRPRRRSPGRRVSRGGTCGHPTWCVRGGHGRRGGGDWLSGGGWSCRAASAARRPYATGVQAPGSHPSPAPARCRTPLRRPGDGATPSRTWRQSGSATAGWALSQAVSRGRGRSCGGPRPGVPAGCRSLKAALASWEFPFRADREPLGSGGRSALRSHPVLTPPAAPEWISFARCPVEAPWNSSDRFRRGGTSERQ